MQTNSKLKKRQSRKDDVIFKIDNSNRGQFDLEQFRAESKSKSKSKTRTGSDARLRKTDRVKGQNCETNKNRDKRNVGSEPREKEPIGLRIVGGKFRGSRLVYAGNNRVRPMKDRVREAVFNLIGPSIVGKRVIDLFSGTGALTIESLSRGAVAATVIEMHLPTAAMLRQNLESLNLTSNCQLCKTDAFYWAKNRELHPDNKLAWIVFCSPPYSFYVEREDEILEMLDNLLKSAPTGSIFVIESDNRFDFNRLPIKPPENKIRSYPPAEIAIFTK
jgi:16S rRNA (guanine966-N2)-methyltransferase